MKKIRTSAVVAAILGGAMLGTIGATAASAQPVSSSSSSAVSSSAIAVAPPAASSPSTTGPTGPAGTTSGSSTDGVPIRPIVDWLKRNASSVIPALKTALRNGLNAFKNWWNGLAGWVRAGINALAHLTVQELFSALWNYFFG
ncbi:MULTISPECIES: hypothetical protein [unclassified Curtobacterium]|uniref:hypothetical protein n=1 Tax=unclassified Curtobacterium TaxID=257496 RepID=UPI000D820CB5|nr:MULTISPECIES: hypothetical protein [unclassified Curtobacterium]PYY34850.1 hypothetical protein DEI89_08145 [Curtobacterium sp. MCBD17_030]PZE37710.1 hypothetical protein DEJ31_06095 [Curtobacterium sp. MCPF17_031]PZF15310.1 hypothetical protein DEJ25_00805 [Curtobacterium sp. MCPF17_011]